ncbi:MAG: hypothetical protein ACR2KJ_02955 [Jatrophihabitans sp.]
MVFTWRYDPQVDLSSISELPSSFENQGDAESWLGLTWRELADAGVQTVSLYDDSTRVYEMPLSSD